MKETELLIQSTIIPAAMRSSIILEGRRLTEKRFEGETGEKDFEALVRDNHKILFGPNTIFVDLKTERTSKSLGGTYPDGALFDFSDPENPEFYIVEVELASHSFKKHIFPQIMTQIGTFGHLESEVRFLGRLYEHITGSKHIEEQFKKYLGRKEIYKALKDIIEDSQNILLIIDDLKPEFEDAGRRYGVKWDDMVVVEVVKQYTAKGRSVFFVDPDFSELGLGRLTDEEEGEYSEESHLENAEDRVVEAYKLIRVKTTRLDPNIVVNPQPNYISFREQRNFTFIRVRRKKLRLVIMLPYAEGKRLFKEHTIRRLKKGVQNFYHGKCFGVDVESKDNTAEIFLAVKKAYLRQKASHD